MLYLISLGLFDEKDVSLRAIEAAKECDRLYVEFYTTGMHTTKEKLSSTIGKEVIEISRSGLEERSDAIIKQAQLKNVGIMAGGDILSATTHISILLDARKMGVKVEVIHGSSVMSAAAKTGLQLYKLGRTVTLTNESAMSCYEGIVNNKKVGLHTLVLLDIPMTVSEGLAILVGLEEKGEKGIITGETKLVAACQLGGPGEAIRYGTIKELQGDKALDNRPAVIIVPGELHFFEKEYLESL
ncbi:MAG: diphthine synthase [Candidatus Aenigmarchaeota archaeon]